MADTIMRTASWKGLNRMPYIANGEMRDMKNLSSDAVPFLTTRKGRKPYTIEHTIPSPEGEAYKTVTSLPEASVDEIGNIYYVKDETNDKKYISGEFYYYENGEWVQGINDKKFFGVTEEVVEYYGGYTFIWSSYRVEKFENKRIDPYDLKYLIGDKIKYIGNDDTHYVPGTVYEFDVKTNLRWEKTYAADGNYKGDVDELPEVRFEELGNTYRFDNKYYICVGDYQGYWKKTDSTYDIVTKVSEEAKEGSQIRFLDTTHGVSLETKYYKCVYDYDKWGLKVHYYANPDAAAESVDVISLPMASEENEGIVYYYVGPLMNGFAECFYEDGVYGWKATEHPNVTRILTLNEYLEQFGGCTLKEIIEIAHFEGSIAVLFVDGDDKTRLYHDKDMWFVNAISGQSGKKLSIVGNRLIVGESGNYLHIKDNVKTFHEVSDIFSLAVRAQTCYFGRDGQSKKISTAVSKNGTAEIKLYSYGGESNGYAEVKNALENEGTGFSFTIKDITYYMKTESVSCEINKEIAGWVDGDNIYREYADILTIRATDSLLDFSWNSSGDKNRTVTFASTDPHYYDVVAWKKRLWGYDKNVLYGTIADIFDAKGKVEWTTGDNSYTESIAQPLWQGGNITGLAALMEGLVYFKEDCLTIVTGNYPAVMSSDTITCKGLPADNRKSVAVANESVYYLSSDGVYRFVGGLPQCISRDAKIKGTNAVGMSDGNKYWLSLQEDSGEYGLYVYDINYGIWHREDNTQAISFTSLGAQVYMATKNEIYNISAPQEDVEWSFELWYDEDTPQKKKYKELIVRGVVGECEVFIKVNDEWKLIYSASGSLKIKFPPVEREEISILFKGKGICEIKSIDRVFEII